MTLLKLPKPVLEKALNLTPPSSPTKKALAIAMLNGWYALVVESKIEENRTVYVPKSIQTGGKRKVRNPKEELKQLHKTLLALGAKLDSLGDGAESLLFQGMINLPNLKTRFEALTTFKNNLAELEDAANHALKSSVLPQKKNRPQLASLQSATSYLVHIWEHITKTRATRTYKPSDLYETPGEAGKFRAFAQVLIKAAYGNRQSVDASIRTAIKNRANDGIKFGTLSALANLGRG